MPFDLKRQHCKQRRAENRQAERSDNSLNMAAAVLQRYRENIGGEAKQARVPQRDEASIADQNVQPHGENAEDENLASDVEIVGVDQAGIESTSSPANATVSVFRSVMRLLFRKGPAGGERERRPLGQTR